MASFGVPGQEEVEREMEFSTLKDGIWSGQLLRRRFDGKLIPVQMRTSLICDAKGNPVAQLRTFHDVSEQANLEAKLQVESESLKFLVAQHTDDVARSAEGYRFLYENSPIASVVTGLDGTIIEANPAAIELLKHTRPQLLEKNLASFLDRAEPYQHYMEGLAKEGKVAEEEIEYRTGNDEVITTRQSGVAIGRKEGKPILVHFLNDVTQTKKLAVEAEGARLQVARADRLASIGQLVAGVAHELNNPLTGVLTFAHMLRKDVPRDSRSEGDIDTIIEAAERCKEIVRSLLDFSRQSVPQKRLCDLSQVLNGAIALTRNQGLVKSIGATLEMEPELPWVFVDSPQIEQVVVNLVCNALDAMVEGDKLTIKVRKGVDHEVAYVEFDVSDTGCGIPEDMLGRVFDPFFTTKSAGKGTGLGLAVAHGIIEQHGGGITVTSTVGQGTTFTVRLPAASEESRHEDKA